MRGQKVSWKSHKETPGRDEKRDDGETTPTGTFRRGPVLHRLRPGYLVRGPLGSSRDLCVRRTRTGDPGTKSGRVAEIRVSVGV